MANPKKTTAPVANTPKVMTLEEINTKRLQIDEIIISILKQDVRMAHLGRDRILGLLSGSTRSILTQYTPELYRAAFVIDTFVPIITSLENKEISAREYIVSLLGSISHSFRAGFWTKNSTNPLINMGNTWEYEQYNAWELKFSGFPSKWAELDAHEKLIAS